MSTCDFDPNQWIEQYGDTLFRYAMARLYDKEIVEDAVQETFVAALRSYSSFSGNFSERTGLVGILKNKIMDHFRKHYREKSLFNSSNDAEDSFVDEHFDKAQHWSPEPERWKNPYTYIGGKGILDCVSPMLGKSS